MAEIIPVFQTVSSHFRQDIIVDGVALTITMDWNTRSGYWLFTITDGTYSIYNKKVTANWPILRANKALFPVLLGDFILTKSDLQAEDEVNYDNLNNGWLLVYYDRFELSDWELANGIQ